MSQEIHRELLSFKIGKEEYGIEILNVQEIRGYEGVTRIANAPSFIKGVANLRGVIVPIIDIRIKFGHSDPTYDSTTVVIVLNLGKSTVGIVVDSVSDVTRLTPEQIRAAPDVGRPNDANYIVGLGILEERMLIIVDIVQLVESDEIHRFEPLMAA
ncbi:purine-binding chemotaxis protein CheW [Massilia sp. UYP11]|uniref:chemotaxis protein CheW n=1 Tax=Massilia sp. UYP11 TaxID=1756385 RepID=UPI003D1B428A